MSSCRFFKLILPICAILFITLPGMVGAASLTLTPAIIDIKAKPRDILKESLTLVNGDNFKQTVYVFVNNLSTKNGRENFLDPSKADGAASLANWIEISRGAIELEPGEKKNVDFSIDVNLRAAPGAYHAVLAFAPGGTRAAAESSVSGAPAAVVNLEVENVAEERLRLKKFAPDKKLFFSPPIYLDYVLENVGDNVLLPAGEIIIYNRRGEEAATVAINAENKEIKPGDVRQFRESWRGGGFGRFKALLALEYGSKSRVTLQDTVFFWVAPKTGVLVFAGVFALIVILFIFLKISIHTK